MKIIQTYIVRVKEVVQGIEYANYLAKVYYVEGGTYLGETESEWILDSPLHGLMKITQEKFMEYRNNTL